jgi:phage pi2 protein 07
MNYKKIKIWEDYFFRFEKGEKKGKYFELINKKLYGYKSQIVKKQKLIEEMYKVIESHNKNLLTPEMRKELGIKEEIIKDNKENKKDEFSFVVIDKADFENIK